MNPLRPAGTGTRIDRGTQNGTLPRMNVTSSARVEGAGTSVRIVDFLEKFATPVPIDLLAKELGRRPEKLADDLAALEAREVVKVDPSTQTVTLVGPAGKSSGLTHLFHWIAGAK